jgi:Lrp/AsnC family leucine-responsive transcriptional regulator
MDSEILRRLQLHARVTWAALATALGVTGPAIAERVKKLEDRGVIRGYRAVIDPSSIGYTLLAFVASHLCNGDADTEWACRRFTSDS